MKERRIDYELLRLLGIFCVVFNHTQLRGFLLYTLPDCGAFNYWTSIILGVLCKMAVPLFLLVSGGLLLHRDEPLETVLKKRVLRILLALLLFSLIQYLYLHRGTMEHPGPADFLRTLWSTGVTIPYWYLYAYLSLMLLLPLLRPMVQGMPDRAFVYLAGLHVLLFALMGTFGIVSGWGEVYSWFWLPMAEPCLFYFIMGYYLAHRFPWEKLKGHGMAVLWLLAVLAVAAMAGLVSLTFRRDGEAIELLRSLTALPVFAVYATVRRLSQRWTPSPRTARVVGSLGSCVFGAYLLEGILRRSLEGVYVALEPRIHVLPACFVWVVLVGVSGLAITWVLKKIPGLRSIL